MSSSPPPPPTDHDGAEEEVGGGNGGGRGLSYGEAEYWDARYVEEGGAPYDWYQRYDALRPFVRRFAPPTSRLLMIGCGSARRSSQARLCTKVDQKCDEMCHICPILSEGEWGLVRTFLSHEGASTRRSNQSIPISVVRRRPLMLAEERGTVGVNSKGPIVEDQAKK